MGSPTLIFWISSGFKYCIVEFNVITEIGLIPIPKEGSTSTGIILA